jgi:hypothetical protein
MDEDAQSSVIENIYKIIGHKEDYINPTIDGELSWRVSSIMTQILRILWIVVEQAIRSINKEVHTYLCRRARGIIWLISV